MRSRTSDASPVSSPSATLRQIYVPFTQPPTYFDQRRWPMALFIKTDGDPTNAVSAVRGELARLDPNLPLYTVRTMDEILVAEVGFDRLLRGVLTVFALVALLSPRSESTG